MSFVDSFVHLFTPAVKAAKRNGGPVDLRYDERGEEILIVGGKRVKAVDQLVWETGAHTAGKLLAKAGAPVKGRVINGSDAYEEDLDGFSNFVTPDLYSTANKLKIR